MKKGISLIVLVITIIVMIIIAGAIIISLSQTNVIDQADNAKYKSNQAEAKSLVALVYASELFETSGDEYTKRTPGELKDAIDEALAAEFGSDYTVTVSSDYKVSYNFPAKDALTNAQ